MKMRGFLLGACLALLATPACAADLMTMVEFGSPPKPMSGFYPQIAPFPPLATQQVDFTAGAVQTSAFNAQTSYVCIEVNARASIKVETGSSTVATTDWPVDANTTWCQGVPKNQSYKLSVIANP